MVDLHGSWPGAAPPPPGWVPPGQARPPAEAPAGLPPRPRFREPHRIGAGPLLAGLGAGAFWVGLFGALGRDLFSYAWWTVLAAVTAWAVAAVLSILGDRGAAVGVAASAGLGWSVAVGFVAARWISSGDWPLW